MFVKINSNYYHPNHIVSFEMRIVDYGNEFTPAKYEILMTLANGVVVSTAMGTSKEMEEKLEKFITVCSDKQNFLKE